MFRLYCSCALMRTQCSSRHPDPVTRSVPSAAAARAAQLPGTACTAVHSVLEYSSAPINGTAGRFLQAVVQYQRIVSWLEMEFGVGKEQQQTIQNFLLVSQLNLAMCYLRLRENALVVENCNKVKGVRALDSQSNKVFISGQRHFRTPCGLLLLLAKILRRRNWRILRIYNCY
ncbi:hypothetical protein J4Q44_G00081200 [Coregonus suidteri]|uniref:Uncharacterized protein n=1 Tax=Coregonus suidteri TaxID=861788 RepID=A0AAN8M3E7_9TELE